MRRGCTSMKILFSAAMNFQMINKTRRVDSREYSRADNVINKQKVGRGEKVHCLCVLGKYWSDYKPAWHDLSQCSVSFAVLHPPLSLLLAQTTESNLTKARTQPPTLLHYSSGLANSAYSMPRCTHIKPWPDPSSPCCQLPGYHFPGCYSSQISVLVFSSGHSTLLNENSLILNMSCFQIIDNRLRLARRLPPSTSN